MAHGESPFEGLDALVRIGTVLEVHRDPVLELQDTQPVVDGFAATDLMMS